MWAKCRFMPFHVVTKISLLSEVSDICNTCTCAYMYLYMYMYMHMYVYGWQSKEGAEHSSKQNGQTQRRKKSK